MEANTYKYKWWERFQIQIGFNATTGPNRDITWKKWFWDPNFGVTWPRQEITNRWQLPESTQWGVDTLSVATAENEKNKFISLVFWMHGALRILGCDFGIGIFYRTQKSYEFKKSG
jgi:hypothetical protein